MADDDIVISGISAYFPQADHLIEFKEKLYAGVDMVTEDDSRWPPGHLGLPPRHGKIRDLCRFDAQFFSTLPKQAQLLDPQVRLLLETSYEAIVDAGYDPETLRGRNIGVFVGISASDTGDALRANAQRTDAYGLLASSRALFANRISYALDFRGPSIAIDTACSSTMTALHEAMLALRSRRCEAAIVGGSNVTLDPSVSHCFQKLGVLSQDGKCKAFDANGDGYVRSETIGAFFIQRGPDARRVYAKIVNVKANTDGYKTEGLNHPSRKAQEDLLLDVYNESGIDALKVAYVEAHGTGTKVGDVEELSAISAVFCRPGRRQPLMVGAVKSNMGHAEGSSGVSSVAKVILAFETGTIAANLHFRHPNAKVPCLHDGRMRVVDKHMRFPGGPVGINSFGFGGTSVHVILEAGPGVHVDSLTRGKPHLPRLALFAGRTEQSLVATLDRAEADGPYPDSAYALLNKVGQPPVKRFPWRGFTIISTDQSDRKAVKGLQKAPTEIGPLWFVFAGVGCQWSGMARQMMHFDVFARSMRKSHELLQPFGVHLIDVVTNEGSCSGTAASLMASIAAIQVALVDVLHAVGVRPDGIVGHSVGEIGCAYADGCLTAEQAVLCAYWRGHCIEQGSLPEGAMAAVGLSWEEAARRCPDEVYPACHNAADSVTISGPAEAVAKVVAELKSEGIFARDVNSLGIAFHSKHMRRVGHALRDALGTVITEPRRRSKRWISTSVPESRWDEPPAQFCSAEYHTNNFLSPVLFKEALQHVPRDAILVEIAPHCLLQGILRRAVGPDATCLGLMKRDADNLEYFLGSLAKLHTLGFQLDLSPLYPPVLWPVPRGTPSIAHLVSWDHSQQWRVVNWKDFSAPQVMAEEVVKIDLEANEEDKYICGHQIDGQVLFPAAGYLVLVWKSLAMRTGKPLDQLAVLFQDVYFHRTSILPENGCVTLHVNVMRLTGNFEVGEAGTVVATGRIRMAEEGERLVDQDPLHLPSETVAYELDAADIYKEFKLRGYEYHGAFRGVLKANVHKQDGRLKWDNNWVTFLDTMFQFCALSSLRCTSALPAKIQSCAIDPKVHLELVASTTGEGLDVAYNCDRNLCRSGGIVLKGVKASVTQRRPVQQTPYLEEYRFVSYMDNDAAKEQRYRYVREYVHVCCDIVRSMRISGPENEMHAFKDISHDLAESVPKRYLEDASDRYSLLRVLLAIRQRANNSTSLTSCVRSTLESQRLCLERDILNTALFEEDPLRSLLDVVLENTESRKVRVLELGTGKSSLPVAPWALPWLSLRDTRFKVEYTVARPNPEYLLEDKVPERINVVTCATSSGSDEWLHQADLTILSRGVADTNDDTSALARRLSSQSKELSFFLLSQRTAFTPAEMFLLSGDGAGLRAHSDDEVVAEFEAHGLLLVGFKSNKLASLLLFRKCLETAHSRKQEVVKVKNAGFEWIDMLREKSLQYDARPVGENVWLLAEDAGTSGIVGLTKCLRLETGGRHVRCVFDASTSGTNAVADFSPRNSKYAGMLQRGLVMNVYRNGQWGSYRHLSFNSCRPQKTTFASLRMQTRGDLSTLQWYESPLKYACSSGRAANDDLLCDVYYAPVNVRDLSLVTGKVVEDALSGKWDSPDCILGQEFSGRDSNGRRVMVMATSPAIATVATRDPDFTWEVPEVWSLEEASTVPLVYLTAYYALVLRGNMRPGESVLIHCGTGAVGQAAVAIALSVGCTVFTTVGSAEERQFLRRRFAELEDRHFASSLDVSLEEHILSETKGRGVHIVLNSLTEGRVQESMRCLARHGRFLQIGDFDLLKNSHLDTSPFVPNVSFHTVILEEMLANESSTEKRRLFEMVRDGITSGVVRPLDAIVFDRDKAEEAFRFLASGKNSATAVIRIRQEEAQGHVAPASPLAVEAISRSFFYGHKSYLIIGGLGGFGLELADWMVTRGCRKLLLTSRSGVKTGYQKLCLHRWRGVGVDVLARVSDVAAEDGARMVVEEAAAMGPVGGIFNLAMVLQDALIENQTVQTFEEACKPKVAGTRLLDQLSREHCPELDYFVVFSSTTSGYGNAGQTNYGYANSVMERICERRVADGLPGLAIQWGPVGDVGVVGDTFGDDNTVMAGKLPQKIRSCIAVMDQFLSQGHPVVCSYVKADRCGKPGGEGSKDLLQSIARILGVPEATFLNMHVTLGELGVDSLMGVEVMKTLERDYDLSLSMQEIRQLTVARIRDISEDTGDASSSR